MRFSFKPRVELMEDRRVPASLEGGVELVPPPDDGGSMEAADSLVSESETEARGSTKIECPPLVVKGERPK